VEIAQKLLRKATPRFGSLVLFWEAASRTFILSTEGLAIVGGSYPNLAIFTRPPNVGKIVLYLGESHENKYEHP
jgi:hypothetical protein